MTFMKALQFTRTDEYYKYMAALLKYKQASKTFKRIEAAFKYSTVPMQRLQFFEATETFSKESKEFFAAKRKYNSFVATKIVEHLNPEITAESLVKLARISIPLSLSEIRKQTERENLMRDMTDEQYDTIKNAALAYMNGDKNKESMSTKDSFPTSTSVYDPTLNDDEPL